MNLRLNYFQQIQLNCKVLKKQVNFWFALFASICSLCVLGFQVDLLCSYLLLFEFFFYEIGFLLLFAFPSHHTCCSLRLISSVSVPELLWSRPSSPDSVIQSDHVQLFCLKPVCAKAMTVSDTKNIISLAFILRPAQSQFSSWSVKHKKPCRQKTQMSHHKDKKPWGGGSDISFIPWRQYLECEF